MLIDKVKNLTYRLDEVASEPTIPDPWLAPIPVPKINTVARSFDWHSAKESNSSISPAGNPDAPRLVCHQSTSEEILLSDELRLKNVSRQIRQQLEKAMALLYLIEAVGKGIVSS